MNTKSEAFGKVGKLASKPANRNFLWRGTRQIKRKNDRGFIRRFPIILFTPNFERWFNFPPIVLLNVHHRAVLPTANRNEHKSSH